MIDRIEEATKVGMRLLWGRLRTVRFHLKSGESRRTS